VFRCPFVSLATQAPGYFGLEAGVGIEPTHKAQLNTAIERKDGLRVDQEF